MTDDNIIRRMRFVCRITKATDTQLRTCNTYCYSAAIMVARTRLNVNVYTYIAWLVAVTGTLTLYFKSRREHTWGYKMRSLALKVAIMS